MSDLGHLPSHRTWYAVDVVHSSVILYSDELTLTLSGFMML